MIKIVVVAGVALVSAAAHAQLFAPSALGQGWANGQAFANGRSPPPQYWAPQQYAPQFQGPQFHNYNLPNGGSLHCTTMGQPGFETTNCY